MTFAAAPRFAASLPIGLFITAAMGALMAALISVEPIETFEPTPAPEYTPLIAEPRPVVVDYYERPPVWTPPAPLPTTGTGIPIPRPDPDTSNKDWLFDGPLGPTPGPQETTFIAQGPVLLFPPFVEYPQSMYPREGSCDVRYDITSAGATTNIQVASCTIQGFARFAERVVERAVYQPAQGEAGPVASAGHVMSVEFRLEE